MLQNAAHGSPVAPSTRAEYEALRVAGGDGPTEKPHDGSNLEQLQTGFERRYGWSPVRIGPPGFPTPPFANFWGLLKPGTGAVVQGSMGSLEPHYRRWDPAFGSGGKLAPHAAYVQRETDGNRVWWMNPLAPKSYDGEWMSKPDLADFMGGFSGAAMFAGIGSRPIPPSTDTEPDDVIVPVNASDLGTYEVDVPKGTGLYEEPDNDHWLTNSEAPASVPGLFRTRADAFGYIAVSWGTGGTDTGKRLLYVKVPQVAIRTRSHSQPYAVTVGGKPAGSVTLP